MFYDYIVQIPVLTKQENRVLVRKAQAGDKRSKDKLITHNLRIVLKAIKKFKGLMDDDDLFSEGVIGMIEAIKPYNPNGKEEFSTYAFLSIQWHVMRAIDNNSRLIRIPVNRKKSIEEYPQAVLNFDKPLQEHSANSFGNLMEDVQAENEFDEVEHRMMQKTLHDDLKSLFSHCHPSTIKCLLQFYSGISFSQIARGKGVSHQSINCTYRYGINTLSKYVDENLKEYLV